MKDFKYTITVPKSGGDSHAAQTVWCEQKFGKRWGGIDNRDGVWFCYWPGPSDLRTYKWQFKNEQDAILFSLTWL